MTSGKHGLWWSRGAIGPVVLVVLLITRLAGCDDGRGSAASRSATLLELDSGRCVEADSGYRCDLYESGNRILAGCFVDYIPLIDDEVNGIFGCRLVADADLGSGRWDDFVRAFRAQGLHPTVGFPGERLDRRPGLKGLTAALSETDQAGGTVYLAQLYDSQSAAIQACAPRALALVLGISLADVKSGRVLHRGRVVVWYRRDFRLARRLHRALDTRT